MSGHHARYTHKTIISIREGKKLKFTDIKQSDPCHTGALRPEHRSAWLQSWWLTFYFSDPSDAEVSKADASFFFYLWTLSLSKITISFILYLKHIIFLFHKIWELEDILDTTITLCTHWRPEMITEWPVQDQRNILVTKLGIDAQILWLLVQPGNM